MVKSIIIIVLIVLQTILCPTFVGRYQISQLMYMYTSVYYILTFKSYMLCVNFQCIDKQGLIGQSPHNHVKLFQFIHYAFKVVPLQHILLLCCRISHIAV